MSVHYRKCDSRKANNVTKTVSTNLFHINSNFLTWKFQEIVVHFEQIHIWHEYFIASVLHQYERSYHMTTGTRGQWMVWKMISIVKSVGFSILAHTQDHLSLKQSEWHLGRLLIHSQMYIRVSVQWFHVFRLWLEQFRANLMIFLRYCLDMT